MKLKIGDRVRIKDPKSRHNNKIVRIINTCNFNDGAILFTVETSDSSRQQVFLVWQDQVEFNPTDLIDFVKNRLLGGM